MKIYIYMSIYTFIKGRPIPRKGKRIIHDRKRDVVKRKREIL